MIKAVSNRGINFIKAVIIIVRTQARLLFSFDIKVK